MKASSWLVTESSSPRNHQDGLQCTGLSSKWALVDHLEYCAADQLIDVDEYDENVGKLFFIGVNADAFPIEGYDDAPAEMWTTSDGDYWAKDGNHVISMKL